MLINKLYIKSQSVKISSMWLCGNRQKKTNVQCTIDRISAAWQRCRGVADWPQAFLSTRDWSSIDTFPYLVRASKSTSQRPKIGKLSTARSLRTGKSVRCIRAVCSADVSCSTNPNSLKRVWLILRNQCTITPPRSQSCIYYNTRTSCPAAKLTEGAV